MKSLKKIAGTVALVGMIATPTYFSLDKYETPNNKTQVEMNIEKMDSFQKSKNKAQILVKEKINFTKNGIQVKIIQIEEKDGLLKVIVEAKRGKEVLKVDNPLFFKNPPIKVSTGKYHKEITNGEEIDVANFEVNPAEALKEIIIQTIELQNK